MYDENLFLNKFSHNGNAQKMASYIIKNKTGILSFDDFFNNKKEVFGENRVKGREIRHKMTYFVRIGFCTILDKDHITHNAEFMPLDQEQFVIKTGKRGRPRKNKTL
jgi:hypothetical protein